MVAQSKKNELGEKYFLDGSIATMLNMYLVPFLIFPDCFMYYLVLTSFLRVLE